MMAIYSLQIHTSFIIKL